jgi:PKD repeat protein
MNSSLLPKHFLNGFALLMLLLFFAAFMNVSAQAPGGVSTGLQVWYKADAGTSTTVNNALLDFWNDSSPNAKNATQAVNANKPFYQTNRINGYPAVRTSTSRFLNADFSGIDNQNYTIFTVSLRQAGGNFNNIVGVQFSGGYNGLSLGYAGSGLIRHIHYGNWANLVCPAFNAGAEIPAILSCQFSQTAGKRVWRLYDGASATGTNGNLTQYAQGSNGRVGRGNDNFGFNGLISEVIIYNRVLTDAEKRQVHTYLSVKYGLSIPGNEHLFYNESGYANDVFGIGRNMTTQALNQSVSNSMSMDDILELRDAISLDDGDYLICGNNNGANAFSPSSGSDCAVQQILGRRWKARKVNDPGNVTLRFDMTGITGFVAEDLLLLIDDEGNGFDADEKYTGTYSAPFFSVTGLNIPDNAIFTIATGRTNWYAVASGNASGAVWATTPSGSPQAITPNCNGINLIVKTGINITNDWSSFSCRNFEIQIGGIWNAGNGTMNASGNIIINGNYNAQSGTMILNGTTIQTISGNGICNAFNLTVNNASGAQISATSGGVVARNLVNISLGTLQTNNKLTLASDAGSTGMILPLISGSISGNVTVQRYHNATTQGWVNLACPVQSKTIQDWNDDLVTTGFAGADYPPPYTFNNVQFYNEAASGGINTGYVGVTGVTNPIVQGRGYFVFMNSGVMNLDVDGQINSGNISLPVSYTNTGNPAADGWSLVGNPYPCTIDWNSLSWTKTNINNAVYVWNAALGQYASYVGGIGTNGGSRYIPSSQSFFVVANAAGASLAVTENCKSSNQGAFKSTEAIGGALTLHISNGIYQDETTLVRNDAGTVQFDPEFDAFKIKSPMTEVPYMATVSHEGYDLSINSMAPINENVVIPLRIEAGVTGTYAMTYVGLEQFARGACVVLEDLLTGNTYDLHAQDEVMLDLEAGNTSLRYQLKISASAVTGVTSSGCPGMEKGTSEIFIAPDSPADVYWYDQSGEEIASAKMVAGTYVLENLGAGFYEVVIENNGECASTRAMFEITASEPILTNAAIVPASCANEDDGAIVLNLIGGTAPYTVIWSDGSTGNGIDGLNGGEFDAFVTDSKGCQQQFSFTVPVRSSLNAEFETIHDRYEMMNGSALVEFYNTSRNAESYSWSFGDASLSSQEENPSHLFNRIGIYDVTLTVTDGDCSSQFTRSVAITTPASEGASFSSEMIGTLTDNGVQIMFFFEKERRIQINAYNVLGQQLIEPIKGTYERETIRFSDRRYAAGSLIEVLDLDSGERALMRMGY